MITLPRFTFSGELRDPPHRHRVLAQIVIDGVRFTVAENWPHTRWWLTAFRTDGGFFARKSNGLTTGSRAKADAWIAAVNAGQVGIAKEAQWP